MCKVKGYITRKTMLYLTGVEYGNYTMNHILGCAHGCLYPCYAYMMKKRFGLVKSYEEWISPYLVSNTLELLDAEIPKLKKHIDSVHLCFSTDPFMYGYDEIREMSLAAIKKLNESNIKCIILTKGILPEQLSELSLNNEYGITLVTLSEKYRKKVEPYASPINERIAALKVLHDKGYKTWVSIEPYPTPNQIDQHLEDILNAVSFVDKIVFGRTNYSKEVNKYTEKKEFYRKQVSIVTKFCIKNNIFLHIKDKTLS